MSEFTRQAVAASTARATVYQPYPAPILSRLECRDCGRNLEWDGEKWVCGACIAAEEDALREAEEEARDRYTEDLSAERAATFADPDPSDDYLLDARDPWEARGLGGDW